MRDRRTLFGFRRSWMVWFTAGFRQVFGKIESYSRKCKKLVPSRAKMIVLELQNGALEVQNELLEVQKEPVGHRGRFWSDIRHLLKAQNDNKLCFWDTIFASFWHRFFDVVLGGVWGAFWFPLGSHLGSCWVLFDQKGSSERKYRFPKRAHIYI